MKEVYFYLSIVCTIYVFIRIYFSYRLFPWAYYFAAIMDNDTLRIRNQTLYVFDMRTYYINGWFQLSCPWFPYGRSFPKRFRVYGVNRRLALIISSYYLQKVCEKMKFFRFSRFLYYTFDQRLIKRQFRDVYSM